MLARSGILFPHTVVFGVKKVRDPLDRTEVEMKIHKPVVGHAHACDDEMKTHKHDHVIPHKH